MLNLTEAAEKKDLFCTLPARHLQRFLRLEYTTIVNNVISVIVMK